MKSPALQGVRTAIPEAIIFLAILAANAFASWPLAAPKGRDLVEDPKAIIVPLFKSQDQIQIQYPGCRHVTLSYNRDSGEYSCTANVASYLITGWRGAGSTSEQSKGWRSRPADALDEESGHVEELANVIGILDQAAISFNRLNVVTREKTTGIVVSVNNSIQFSIPKEKAAHLFDFLRNYSKGIDADKMIQIYGDE